jgi:chromosomal replication initiation ATPase DnaA
MDQIFSAASGISSATHARAAGRAPSRLSVIVADAFGICAHDLVGVTRGCARVALARQSGMYLARVSLGLTLSQAASLFGRDRTTAAYACRVVEDRRDDPAFDAFLVAIEARLVLASKALPQ